MGHFFVDLEVNVEQSIVRFVIKVLDKTCARDLQIGPQVVQVAPLAMRCCGAVDYGAESRLVFDKPAFPHANSVQITCQYYFARAVDLEDYVENLLDLA